MISINPDQNPLQSLTKTVRIRTVFVHFRTSPRAANYYDLKTIYLGNGIPVEKQYADGKYPDNRIE